MQQWKTLFPLKNTMGFFGANNSAQQWSDKKIKIQKCRTEECIGQRLQILGTGKLGGKRENQN